MRTKALPAQHLADGGYMNVAAVERSAERGIAAITAYRRRMASAEG